MPANPSAIVNDQPKDDITVVREFLGAMERLDLDAVIQLASLNIKYQNVPLPPTQNRAQFERVITAMGKYMTRFEVQYRVIEKRGNKVYTDRIDIAEGHGFRMDLRVQGTFVVQNGYVTEWIDRFSWLDLGKDVLASVPRIARNVLTLIRSSRA
ncbi:MAG: limonene-1,2-epoxide hydrolase family protein [Polyangiales bacterium]